MQTARTASSRRAPALLAIALAATTGLATLTPLAGPGTGPPASTAVADATTRVVVSGAGGVAAAVAAVQAAGGTLLDQLPLVGGVSAELPSTAVLPPTLSVVPDRPLEMAGLTQATTPAAVSTVRETVGLTRAPGGEGAGVTVAVVDTGVASGLADLAGRITHVDVSGDGSRAGQDGYGHGTFVAGLVAGDGAASGGAYSGIAPAARVLDVKVADDDGVTDLITVLRGLEVVARSKDVDVVSLALSSGSPLPYQLDPLGVALQALWQRGTVVVVPAGNTGGTVTSPGSHPVLLTAGGLDETGTAGRADDTVASWSARGPAAQGVAKPDLVAPGTSVISLLAPGSDAAGHKKDLTVPAAYLRGSGTSFSTAVTAGAAAILVAERKNLDPDQVKGLLTGTAYTAPGLQDAKAAGAGGLDVAAARTATAPKSDSSRRVAPVPGGPKGWAALLDAFLSDDPEAAANSWSALTPAARHWAARHWAELTPEARHWAIEQWNARHWADSETSVEEWAARHWAARHWATEEWAARHWAGNGASDPEWSARHWAARHWAGDRWEARHWADDSWAARHWAARHWAARHWAADEWSARHWADGEWAARHWAADDWAARHWASTSWSARHWSALDWR